MNWEYKLDTGSELSKFIKDSRKIKSYIKILETIKSYYDEILNNYPCDDDCDIDEEIECYTEELDNCIEKYNKMISNGVISTSEYDDIQGFIDDFYRFCDYWKIKVEL